MVDERTGLTTRVIGKTKRVFRGASKTYGSTSDSKLVADASGAKHKYRNLKFLRKLWNGKSMSGTKTKEDLLEEGPTEEKNSVTVVTYALCFIMMLAGLSVKMN